eukprot:gene15584-biopygen679
MFGERILVLMIYILHKFRYVRRRSPPFYVVHCCVFTTMCIRTSRGGGSAERCRAMSSRVEMISMTIVSLGLTEFVTNPRLLWARVGAQSQARVSL